jgi:hypothetical protein
VKRADWLGIGACTLLWGLSACGHKASAQECDEIVETIVRLELKAADAGTPVAEEVKATKESLKGDTMKRCVGRRITDSAMQCVRNAATAQEIEEKCFD